MVMTDRNQRITIRREDFVNEAPTEIVVWLDLHKDWTIVNAPRPLWGGELPETSAVKRAEWQGEFRHGRFYAAAAATDRMAPPAPKMFCEHWREDDAWPVEVLTDDEIRQRVWAHVQMNYPGTDEAEVRDSFPSLCRALNLPDVLP